jgi:hypothetical protein
MFSTRPRTHGCQRDVAEREDLLAPLAPDALPDRDPAAAGPEHVDPLRARKRTPRGTTQHRTGKR